MSNNQSKFVEVEIVSNITEKTVLTFKAQAENVVTTAYNRLAAFMDISKTTASMNYHVNVTK